MNCEIRAGKVATVDFSPTNLVMRVCICPGTILLVDIHYLKWCYMQRQHVVAEK